MKFFPPVFRAGAAILSEKIDELARKIASILNGGLDALNLSSALRLDVSAFAERNSPYALRAVVHPNLTVGTFGVVRYASRIVGWGISGPNSVITIQANGVTIATIYPKPTAVAPTSVAYARDYATTSGLLTPPVNVAAGALLTVLASGSAQITLSLDTPHQA